MSGIKSITANGYQFSYTEEGSGEPLILVHGTLGDYRTWRRQMKPFGKHYRTIAYSRRYHFPNTWSEGTGDYTMEGHAADLAELQRVMKASPAHLVCASWGGNVALQTALVYPDLVRTLVLCEPPSLPLLETNEMLKPLATDFYGRTLDPAREAMQAGRFEDGIRIFIDGVMGAEAYDRTPDGVKRYFMQNATEFKAELTSANYFAPITRERLDKLRCPVLLVTGEQSPRLFHQIITIIAEAVPSAMHIEIPHASHGIHADNAAAFNSAVLDFLHSFRSSTAPS